MITNYARCLEFYFHSFICDKHIDEYYKFQYTAPDNRRVFNDYELRSTYAFYMEHGRLCYNSLATRAFDDVHKRLKIMKKIRSCNAEVDFEYIYDNIVMLYFIKKGTILDRETFKYLKTNKNCRFELYEILINLFYLVLLYKNEDFKSFRFQLEKITKAANALVTVPISHMLFLDQLSTKIEAMDAIKAKISVFIVVNILLMWLIEAQISNDKTSFKKYSHMCSKLFVHSSIKGKALNKFFDEFFANEVNGNYLRNNYLSSSIAPKRLKRPDSTHLLYLQNVSSQVDLNNTVKNTTLIKSSLNKNSSKKFSQFIQKQDKLSKFSINARSHNRYKSTLLGNTAKFPKKSAGAQITNTKNHKRSLSRYLIERVKCSDSINQLETTKNKPIELKNGVPVFLPFTQKLNFRQPKYQRSSYYAHLTKPSNAINQESRVKTNIGKLQKIVRFITCAFKFILTDKQVRRRLSKTNSQTANKAQQLLTFLNRIQKPDASSLYRQEFRMLYAGYGNYNNTNLRLGFSSLREIDNIYGKEELPMIQKNHIKRYIRNTKLVRSKSFDPIAFDVRQLKLEAVFNNFVYIVSVLLKKAAFKHIYFIMVNSRIQRLNITNLTSRRNVYRNSRAAELRTAISSISNIGDQSRTILLDFSPISNSIFLLMKYERPWQINFKLKLGDDKKRISLGITIEKIKKQITMTMALKRRYHKCYKKLIDKKHKYEVMHFFINKIIYFNNILDEYKTFKSDKSPMIALRDVKDQKNCHLNQFSRKLIFLLFKYFKEKVNKNQLICDDPIKPPQLALFKCLSTHFRSYNNYRYLNSEFTNLYKEEPHVSEGINLEDIMRKTLVPLRLYLLFKNSHQFYFLHVNFAAKTLFKSNSILVHKIQLYDNSKETIDIKLPSDICSKAYDHTVFIKQKLRFYEEFINCTKVQLLDLLKIDSPQEGIAKESTVQKWSYKEQPTKHSICYTDYLRFKQTRYVIVSIGNRVNCKFSLQLINNNESLYFIFVNYQ